DMNDSFFCFSQIHSILNQNALFLYGCFFYKLKPISFIFEIIFCIIIFNFYIACFSCVFLISFFSFFSSKIHFQLSAIFLFLGSYHFSILSIIYCLLTSSLGFSETSVH